VDKGFRCEALRRILDKICGCIVARWICRRHKGSYR
jgi:hypothetical protein